MTSLRREIKGKVKVFHTRIGMFPNAGIFIRRSGRFVLLCLILILCTGHFCHAYKLKERDDGWIKYKSDHFIICYHQGLSDEYVKDFSRKCEDYYYLITKRLGFNRYDFWLWEDRTKIYIFKTKEDYIKTTNRPMWSGGSVHIKTKEINTFYSEINFFDGLLPHELAHIILREFIGLKARVPLWFEEGVACANEQESYLKYLLVTKGFVEKGLYLSIVDMDKITGKDIRVASIFYGTSASIIIYLLEEYKSESFVEFCRGLRDGLGFYEAMGKIYGIKNAEELNTKFLEFMKSQRYEEIATRDSLEAEW